MIPQYLCHLSCSSRHILYYSSTAGMLVFFPWCTPVPNLQIQQVFLSIVCMNVGQTKLVKQHALISYQYITMQKLWSNCVLYKLKQVFLCSNSWFVHYLYSDNQTQPNCSRDSIQRLQATRIRGFTAGYQANKDSHTETWANLVSPEDLSLAILAQEGHKHV